MYPACLDREKNMRPEITFLISNYNKGPYIDDCLASLFAQTSQAWRCLICDDRSTDDSLERVRPWLGQKIVLLQNEENLGVRYTLDRLIRAATTDIVGVLDADDTLQPEATAMLLEAYARREDIGFVYSKFTSYSADLSEPLDEGWGDALPAGGTALIHDCVGAIRTFRVSAYRQTSGILQAPLYAEDRDLIYKLEEVTRFGFVDRSLYNYRILPHSQSHDPTTREIALSSHRQAYIDALKRRRVTGLRRIGYLMYIHNYYWMGQNHARWRRYVARQTWRATRRFVPFLGCR